MTGVEKTDENRKKVNEPQRMKTAAALRLPADLQGIESYFTNMEPPEHGRISEEEATGDEKTHLQSGFIVYENGIVMMDNGRIVDTLDRENPIRPGPGQYKSWIYYKVEKTADTVITPTGENITVHPVVYEDARELEIVLEDILGTERKRPKWNKMLKKDTTSKLEHLRDARLFSDHEALTEHMQGTIQLLKQAKTNKTYKAYAKAAKRIFMLEYAISRALIANE